MPRYRTIDLDFLEIVPNSSNALKENVRTILDKSDSYSAAIASVDPDTGKYRIILEGVLEDNAALRRTVA